MLKAIVIDDDPSLFTFISKELAKQESIEIVGYAANIKAGKALLGSVNPDVVFLDIDLPDGTGFDLLYPELRAEIIFITAYDEYAVRAFSYAAIDYLLKPIDPKRLKMAVSRLLDKSGTNDWKRRMDVFTSNRLHGGDQKQRVVLKMNYGYEVVTIADIVHCQANGNYSEIHLKDDSVLMSSKTLKEFSTMLENMGFFRCHQSHLINLASIKAFKSFKSEITLITGASVKLARSKQKEFSELMEGNRSV